MRCKGCGNSVSVLENMCPLCGKDQTGVDAGKGFNGYPGQRKTGYLHVAESAEIDVDMRSKPVYGWSLYNTGVPLVERIEVANRSSRDVYDLILTTELVPDYGRPWVQKIEALRRGERISFPAPFLPLYRSKFLSLRESDEAWLSTEVASRTGLLRSRVVPVRVLAYNEWSYDTSAPDSLAGFVLPNSDTVTDIIRQAGYRLPELSGSHSFDGYQSGGPAKVEAMVHAIYDELGKGLKLRYMNPPASFEEGSQKILLPDAIVRAGRGSCLDLALCFAACIERIGLYPVVFLVPGHALLGVWMTSEGFLDFRTGDSGRPRSEGLSEGKDLSGFVGERYKKYVQLIADGVILPLNSVTFTEGKGFHECKEEGRKLSLGADSFDAIVDIVMVRQMVKPLPV